MNWVFHTPYIAVYRSRSTFETEQSSLPNVFPWESVHILMHLLSQSGNSAKIEESEAENSQVVHGEEGVKESEKEFTEEAPSSSRRDTDLVNHQEPRRGKLVRKKVQPKK